jgi:putative aldouronate transport system permease protein
MLMAANIISDSIPESQRLSVFPLGIQMATIIITMLPIICVYPFLQKYFVKGLVLGAVKT